MGLLIDNDGIARNPISDPAWRTSNAPYVMRDFEAPRCTLCSHLMLRSGYGLLTVVKRSKFGLIVELASGAFHTLALTDAAEVCARKHAATA